MHKLHNTSEKLKKWKGGNGETLFLCPMPAPHPHTNNGTCLVTLQIPLSHTHKPPTTHNIWYGEERQELSPWDRASVDGVEAPGVNRVKNNYLTGTAAGRQFCYIIRKRCIYHLISQHVAANTCGSFNEIWMSPVIIDTICLALPWHLWALSVAASQGIFYSDMGYK